MKLLSRTIKVFPRQAQVVAVEAAAEHGPGDGMEGVMGMVVIQVPSMAPKLHCCSRCWPC